MHVSSIPRFERLSPAIRRLLIGLGVAGVYCIAARLALILAIQPGYAAPLWPAAGIALTALLRFGPGIWPAIVLGSFLANVATAFDASSTAALVRSLGIAAGIAAGAALQALVGAVLVRR